MCMAVHVQGSDGDCFFFFTTVELQRTTGEAKEEKRVTKESFSTLTIQ